MSKHQFTDIRVAIEPDNPAVQRLEFKCIKCGSCKAVCTDYIKKITALKQLFFYCLYVSLSHIKQQRNLSYTNKAHLNQPGKCEIILFEGNFESTFFSTT